MSRYTEAKEKAHQLIKDFALSIPVQVFELAKRLGIDWKGCTASEMSKIVTDKLGMERQDPEFSNWEEVLGFFDNEGNTFYINQENQPITRVRFTLAHEIGHLQLHRSKGKNHFRQITLLEDIFRPHAKEEIEANYFAGYLLMPDSAIEQKLVYSELMPPGEYMIREFAKIFGVSAEAMRIRFKTFKEEHPDIWKKYRMNEKLF